MTVAQQIQTAQTLPADVGAPLTGQLVCYARWVIDDEWPRMENGTLGEDINPWGAAMFQTLQDVELGSPQQEAAYGKWLDQTSDREAARQARIHGSAGLMPTPLWIALFFISAIVLAYILGFADSSERVWVQGMFMGSVVAVITTMLLLLAFLDKPYRGDVGGLQPVAMERTVLLIDQQLAVIGGDLTIPCDDERQPDVTAAAATSTAARPEGRDWVEIVATVLLAFAAVATAWSSYQANRWNGETTKASSRVNALRIDAARAQGLAQAQTQVDIAMFFQWVNATETDERGPRRVLRRPVPARVPAGLRRLAGHRPAHQPRRPTDAVRHGRLPVAGPRRRRAARRRSRGRWPPSSAATSNAQPTTCSPSSCSPSPCSSPA